MLALSTNQIAINALSVMKQSAVQLDKNIVINSVHLLVCVSFLRETNLNLTRDTNLFSECDSNEFRLYYKFDWCSIIYSFAMCLYLCVCAVSSVRVITFKDIASYSDFSV